jgi:flagellin
MLLLDRPTDGQAFDPLKEEIVMGLRINNNIAALNSYRNLSVTDGQMSKSLEKLSSGFRINRAADDAAGLSISEGLRSQIGGLKVANRNAQDGVSVVQTAEGALTEVHSILQRMRDLAVQSSNSGSQDADAQAAAQTEFSQLNSELDRISNTTKFGSQKLLDGSFGVQQGQTGTTAAWTSKTVAASTSFDLTASGLGTVSVNLNAGTYATADTYVAEINRGLRAALVGAGGTGNEVVAKYTVNSGGTGLSISLNSASSFTTAAPGAGVNALTAAGITAGASGATGTGGVFQVGANAGESIAVSIGAVNTTTLGTASLNLTTNASAAITQLDVAIKSVSTTRATLGAYQNRLEHTINNLNVATENLTASESRIRDTDMAAEMTNFTRTQILTQAGTAMLAQANQAPQQVLQLLRG